ncbi:hypothetical protein V6N13_124198 [Hibiscus sabdariffa]|uniref:Uncharacterized protein n=1 Tax=Hibiscus sabdariffa TaxID=183260 RepID=A0ABR2S1H6_9ROSI
MMETSKALSVMARVVESLNRADKEIDVAFTQAIKEEVKRYKGKLWPERWSFKGLMLVSKRVSGESSPK